MKGILFVGLVVVLCGCGQAPVRVATPLAVALPVVDKKPIEEIKPSEDDVFWTGSLNATLRKFRISRDAKVGKIVIANGLGQSSEFSIPPPAPGRLPNEVMREDTSVKLAIFPKDGQTIITSPTLRCICQISCADGSGTTSGVGNMINPLLGCSSWSESGIEPRIAADGSTVLYSITGQKDHSSSVHRFAVIMKLGVPSPR